MLVVSSVLTLAVVCEKPSSNGKLAVSEKK